MTTLIVHGQHAMLTLFLAMILPLQEYVRVPNDRTGVGASGKIGRGTSRGEQFVPRATPTQTAPAWAYSTPSIPIQAAPSWVYAAPSASLEPSPASATINPTETANRDQTRRVEPPINLPALARTNPYLAYHRGWVGGFWNGVSPSPGRGRLPPPPGRNRHPGRAPAILGMGLGWNLPAWLIGPMAYRWGYFPYDNPFARRGPSPGTERPFDDYSRPIRILNPVPTEKLLDEALTAFRAARDAFRRGLPTGPRPDRCGVAPDARRPRHPSIPRPGPLRAPPLRGIGRGALRHPGGWPRLGLGDDDRPLRRPRSLHLATPAAGGLLRGEASGGGGPVRAGLPLLHHRVCRGGSASGITSCAPAERPIVRAVDPGNPSRPGKASAIGTPLLRPRPAPFRPPRRPAHRTSRGSWKGPGSSSPGRIPSSS